jgi:hypothetical protein
MNLVPSLTTTVKPPTIDRLQMQVAVAALAAAITVLGILIVNPQSLGQFAVFFCIWNGLIVLFHQDELPRFSLAFLVNSSFIVIYVAIQAATYPDTYGTTSPLSSSWTDDSYFFSLAADSIPPDLLTRANYWLYTHTFSSIIHALTPLPIEHPLDALFFQSGTAAVLATFTRRLTLQWSGTEKLADTTYFLVLACPFLMMNGGVILLRDTLSAALLVYSICSFNSRNFLLAGSAIALQLAVRPGTGLILIPAYGVLYYREIMTFVRAHPLLVATGLAVATVIGYLLASLLLELLKAQVGPKSVGFLGREVLSELNADPNANALFYRIQSLPFGVRLLLNAGYIFAYPFLVVRSVVSEQTLDLRNVTMNLLIPIYAFWLNAWFFAAALSGVRAIKKQQVIIYAIATILIVIGTYSLQTRHKTIIYPLYYIIVAVGFRYAPSAARRQGYLLSAALLAVQIAAGIR